MKTLDEWSLEISVEYDPAEAIQPWLAEREGMSLCITRGLEGRYGIDGGGWICTLRPSTTSGTTIISTPCDTIEEAIAEACRACEARANG